jgi:arylsulfatase A-like enzyme
MFTGLSTPDLVPRSEMAIPHDVTTLAEVLSANGYQTGGFIGNLLYLGRDTRMNQGFTHYAAFRYSLGQHVLSFEPGRALTNSPQFRKLIGETDILNRKPAEEVNREFLSWLSEERRPAPFFAFLNYYDAHEPYKPPEPYRSRFGRAGPEPRYWYDTYRVTRVNLDRTPPESELGAQTGAYEGQIAHVDAELGKLVAELRRRRLLDNTLLIVTSDHGEAFGEHGLLGHFNNMHIQTLRVPLVISFPGRIPQGVVVSEPVSLRHIPATVMDLLGLSHRFRFPGASLSKYWRTSESGSPKVEVIESRRFALDTSRSVVSWPYHFLLTNRRREELYNLASDPDERRNLAIRSEFRPVVERLRSLAY